MRRFFVLLVVFLWALPSASAYYAMTELERNSGFTYAITSSLTTSDYLIGQAFGFQRLSFTKGSAFAATVYACDTPTYSASTCQSKAVLTATTDDVQIYTGKPYVVVDVTTAETGSNVSYLSYRGHFTSAKSRATKEWVTCSDLPDPPFTPVAVTSASDLHTVFTNNCASGCILELAAGTYTDTNVTVGVNAADSTVKVGSLSSVTGEVLIRAADPANKPLLRSALGSKAAVFYLNDVAGRVRLENVKLDGRRGSQTSGAVTVCTDTTPADGTCDTGSQTSSTAGGFHLKSTTGGVTQACLYGVEVIETVGDAIMIRNAANTTVESSTTTGAGCDSTTCPLLSVPNDSITNSYKVVGRAINILQSDRVGIIGGTFTSQTKSGPQCFEVTRCYIVNNTITTTGNAGIIMLGSSGIVRGNTISGVGVAWAPNTTSTYTGHGVEINDSNTSDDFAVVFQDNSVTNTFGGSYTFGLSGIPLGKSRLQFLTNTSTNACLSSVNTEEAAFLLGDATDSSLEIVSMGNTVTNSGCEGFRARNLTRFYSKDDRVVSTTGQDAIVFSAVASLYHDNASVTDDINIDAGSTGTLTNCTLSGGAAVTGTLNGGVVRTNCGA